jgi:hypothetical protein
MNHLFSAYIGVFMDVYLDDIIVYSKSLEDHVEHCKLIFDILAKEVLYLSEKKLQILPSNLKILGWIIDDDGIQMDPVKVDSVLKWKTPTGKEGVLSFLGCVDYLADNVSGICIPMGILHGISGSASIFCWDDIHQQAFDEIKEYVYKFCEHRQKPINYWNNAPPINLVTNASSSGLAGVISQGEN